MDTKGKSIGLLVGIRNNTDIIANTVMKHDNLIVMEILKRSNKIIIANIYNPCSRENRKIALKNTHDILEKYENSKQYDGVIIVGDWNSIPESIQGMLNRKGSTIYINTCSL